MSNGHAGYPEETGKDYVLRVFRERDAYRNLHQNALQDIINLEKENKDLITTIRILREQETWDISGNVG